jgi:DNA polymerase III epsilon subunit-like protein
MHLVFDTETSGLPISAPPDHPRQPRVLQLGAQLLDASFVVRAELNAIIAWPEPMEIHPLALKTHGISYELTQQFGLPPELVMETFERFVAMSLDTAAFNAPFDFQMVNITAAQTRRPKPALAQTPFCPMRALTPIVKLPGKFPGQFKWPTLQEAHTFCVGKPFDGAHDAMADVRALATVYKWIYQNHANLLCALT